MAISEIVDISVRVQERIEYKNRQIKESGSDDG